MNSSIEEIAKFRDTIEVELPKQELYNLVARYKLPSGQTFSLNDDNFIQRGSKLVNTDWMCVVQLHVAS